MYENIKIIEARYESMYEKDAIVVTYIDEYGKQSVKCNPDETIDPLYTIIKNDYTLEKVDEDTKNYFDAIDDIIGNLEEYRKNVREAEKIARNIENNLKDQVTNLKGKVKQLELQNERLKKESQLMTESLEKEFKEKAESIKNELKQKYLTDKEYKELYEKEHEHKENLKEKFTSEIESKAEKIRKIEELYENDILMKKQKIAELENSYKDDDKNYERKNNFEFSLNNLTELDTESLFKLKLEIFEKEEVQNCEDRELRSKIRKGKNLAEILAAYNEIQNLNQE